MKLRFLGAARTVTGSCHLLEANGAKLLLDCGLFQGKRKESFERNRRFVFEPAEIHNVVLSHARRGPHPGLGVLSPADHRGRARPHARLHRRRGPRSTPGGRGRPHGEERQSLAFAERLRECGFPRVEVPEPGETYRL